MMNNIKNIEKNDLEQILAQAFEKGKRPKPVNWMGVGMVLCLGIAAGVALATIDSSTSGKRPTDTNATRGK